MSIIEIVSLLKSLGIDLNIYPLGFPDDSPSVPTESLMIETGSSAPTSGDVQEFILTVTARAEHPMRAEEISLDVMDKLHKVTSIDVGDTEVILIRKQQKIPLYAGKDETGRHYFTNDFRVLID